MRILIEDDVYKTAVKLGITDEEIIDCAIKTAKGQVYAKIGAHLVKQRIHKSLSRTLVIIHVDDIFLFVHFFPKSRTENIKPSEEEDFRKAAIKTAALPTKALLALKESDGWRIIDHDDPEGDRD